MSHEQGTFTAPGNEEIFYQCWLPESESKAALIVVHGVAEHSGRYMNLVNALVPQGFSVYALDHYGHGKSGGRRLFVPDFSIYTHCLDILVDRVREWEPGKKCFLVGHSMGGLIAATYLSESRGDNRGDGRGDNQDASQDVNQDNNRHNNQTKIDGAVFSGAAVKVPDNISVITIWAARLFSTLLPTLGIRKLDYTQISRDPDVVQAYANDPLVSVEKLTARLAEQLIHACLAMENRAGRIRIPVCILHGGADKLVEPDASRRFHATIASEDKELEIYPEKFHEIFNDPGHDQVFSDISNWLNRRLG